MKRIALLQHLHSYGCVLVREGARHSIFINSEQQRVSSVPRHTEIENYLAKKICRDLGIPLP